MSDEHIGAALKAAGILVDPASIQVPRGARNLTNAELEDIGRVPPGTPTTTQMIDEDRDGEPDIMSDELLTIDDLGWTREQAIAIRAMYGSIAEDWDDPSMDAYDKEAVTSDRVGTIEFNMHALLDRIAAAEDRIAKLEARLDEQDAGK